MSEKDRDEIAGMLTNREIESLGAPWMASAQAPVLDTYLPPLPQYIPPKDNGDDSKPSSLEGSVTGSVGSIGKTRRLDPDAEMRLRYRRSF